MLVYEDNPQRDVGTNMVYTWNKHWLYINNSSVHSVGVGADSSRPSIPNCIITPRITVGCTRTNIIYSWNKHWLRINNPQRTFRGHRVRFIAPVCTKLYKCNHASQWVYVDKHWCTKTIRSVYSVIFGHDKSAPTVGVREQSAAYIP